MPALLLGPMLRYVSATSATIWMETDAPCTVSVSCPSSTTASTSPATTSPATTRTFTVAGHHYALAIVEDLEPGSTTPYEIHLDGHRRWPETGTGLPPSVIRTSTSGSLGAAGATDGSERPIRLAFGSCRVLR